MWLLRLWSNDMFAVRLKLLDTIFVIVIIAFCLLYGFFFLYIKCIHNRKQNESVYRIVVLTIIVKLHAIILIHGLFWCMIWSKARCIFSTLFLRFVICFSSVSHYSYWFHWIFLLYFFPSTFSCSRSEISIG